MRGKGTDKRRNVSTSIIRQIDMLEKEQGEVAREEILDWLVDYFRVRDNATSPAVVEAPLRKSELVMQPSTVDQYVTSEANIVAFPSRKER